MRTSFGDSPTDLAAATNSLPGRRTANFGDLPLSTTPQSLQLERPLEYRSCSCLLLEVAPLHVFQKIRLNLMAQGSDKVRGCQEKGDRRKVIVLCANHASSSLGPQASRLPRAPPGASVSQGDRTSTSCSRCALAAGGTPAVPAKSLRDSSQGITKGYCLSRASLSSWSCLFGRY